MVKNDGSCTNEMAFWKHFSSIHGEESSKDLPIFTDFYRNEFQLVKKSCSFNPKAKEVIDLVKSKGLRVALATNPLFPSIATESRIKWAGLDPQDFELFTTYENSRYCKPNIKYYLDIMESLGVKPEECLMVGNDVAEDMVTSTIGMKVFLLTDCLLNTYNLPTENYPQGDFDDLINFINKL